MSTTRIKDLVTGAPTGPEFLVFDSASGGTRKVALSALFAALSGVTLDFNGSELSNIVQLNATEVDASIVASSVFVAGLLSPTSIGANQNDYAPTGFASASFVRLTASGAYSITGLAGGANGRAVVLVNIGSNPITLAHENASSTAANRFACPDSVDFYLQPGAVAWVVYDTTSTRWRLVAMRAWGVATTSSAYTSASNTIKASDPEILMVDTTSNAVVLTLPPPASKRRFTVKKKAGGTNKITIAPNASEKIEGTAANYDLPGSATAYSASSPQAWLVFTDGTDWYVA